MKEVTFEESRKIQLDILLYFDAFCKQNGLQYSLGEGSLIGAVRHKGFIPWDDDIDLLMPRKDYDRFRKIYNGKYRLITLKTEKQWWSCYSRLTDERTIVEWNKSKGIYHGLWIAILPIDNFPDDPHEWQRISPRIGFWKTIGYMKRAQKQNSLFQYDKNTSFFRNTKEITKRLFLKSVPNRVIGRKLESLITKFNNTQTKNKGSMACVWHAPWVFPASVFSSYVEMDFEGYKLPVIKDYDVYLRCQYGDYMQLPPVEERIPKHNYKAYWKDNNNI